MNEIKAHTNAYTHYFACALKIVTYFRLLCEWVFCFCTGQPVSANKNKNGPLSPSHPVVGVHDDVHLDHVPALERAQHFPLAVGGAVCVRAFLFVLMIWCGRTTMSKKKKRPTNERKEWHEEQEEEEEEMVFRFVFVSSDRESNKTHSFL